MTYPAEMLIDWGVFETTRASLGPHFHRVFGYLREDGARSVSFIEKAIRETNAAQLILPANCIAGEALHFGARRLAMLAGQIEDSARDYVELRLSPVDLVAEIARLRPLFNETMAALSRAASPLQEKVRAV
jgi:hypothetical protein